MIGQVATISTHYLFWRMNMATLLIYISIVQSYCIFLIEIQIEIQIEITGVLKV
jgi:hypothetical protein